MMGNRCRCSLLPAHLVALILLTGCVLQNLPPVEIYTLEPGWSQGEPAQTEKKGSHIIQIAPVRGAGVFASTDILYTDRQNSQYSYAYSRWREAPVRSMQTVLEVALGKSGLFRAVLPPTSISGADLLLESTLLEFGHVLGEERDSEGVVRVRFHLVDNSSKRVVATQEMVATMETVTSDARGATTAINQAAIQVVADLVVWLGAVTK
ncbi:MAG: ABC-type transport auxiliary lipoprotein family protein [Desulfobulbaceae bacterium]